MEQKEAFKCITETYGRMHVMENHTQRDDDMPTMHEIVGQRSESFNRAAESYSKLHMLENQRQHDGRHSIDEGIQMKQHDVDNHEIEEHDGDKSMIQESADAMAVDAISDIEMDPTNDQMDYLEEQLVELDHEREIAEVRLKGYESEDVEFGFEGVSHELEQDVVQQFLDLDSDELEGGEGEPVESQSEVDELEEEDEILLTSEREAENMLIEMVRLTKESFGVDVAKSVIIKACRANNVELFKSTSNRESTTNISNMDVKDIKDRVQKFVSATLDTNVELKPMDSKDNILDNCTTVNTLITAAEASKDVSQVRLFTYLFKMHQNIQAAKEQPEFKVFLKALQERLHLKKGSAVSKLQRKCKRVNQLVTVVGNAAGAFLLGMFITVFTLKNGSDEQWKLLVKALRENTDYLAFTMTLGLAADGVTPIMNEE